MEALDQADAALALAQDAARRMDVDAVIAHLSTAVRAATAADDPCRAALACARLGDAYAVALGQLTVAGAWFARARRLVEDRPPCLEQGWVAVAAMGCDVDDPDELLRCADYALDRARRFGDLNLELKALADGGLALVRAGRVDEGMARLDEAMALAAGPADDADTTSKSVCSFFTACYHAADVARAGTWAEPLRRRGLLAMDAPGPAFVSSHCDSVRAALLIELGRWGEAESVLVRAHRAFEAVVAGPSWHPAIALADLRTRQGRLAEAEALLLGKEQSLEALLPAVRLHLARGDVELARAVAQRGLRAVGPDRLRAVELLAALVDVALAGGDLEAARAAAAELAARLEGVDVPALRARAAAAHARLAQAEGRNDGAVAVLEAALDTPELTSLPWRRVMLLVALARCGEAAGDHRGAAREAAAAADLLRSLDVVLPPTDLALLARLTPGAARAAATAVSTAELRRERTGWTVRHGDTVAKVADTKGMRYLAQLIAYPGTERHALDLVDRVEGTAPGGPDRRSLGDAGPLLDDRARTAYRRRIEALRAEADEAIAAGRLEAAEAAQAELDALVGELARAFGLGGRGRPAGSATERARLNVTRALRSAIARLADVAPQPAAVLDRRVRTGTYCAFEPDPALDGVRWIVQREVNGRRAG